MKELEPIQLDKKQIEIFNQRQIEKHKKLFASITPNKGHTVWEINCGTGDIVPAEFKNERVEFVDTYDLITATIASTRGFKVMPNGSKPVVKRDIDAKENCVYIAALNKKSAAKKFLRFVSKKVEPK